MKIRPGTILRSLASVLILGTGPAFSGAAVADGVNVELARENSCTLTTFQEIFRNDPDTAVLQVRQYKAGDLLPNVVVDHGIEPGATPQPVKADLCHVKLVVGPAYPGPANAPSTSAGIGIEIWLPSKANWNGRFNAIGGAGWSGGDATNLTRVSTIDTAPDSNRWRSSSTVAGEDGSATAMTDTGHTSGNVAKFLNPDGSFNTRGLEDFSIRSLREQAIKGKAVVAAYYGRPARYNYFTGGSGGGRQAFQIAQRLPDEYDGIFTAVPGVSFMRFLIAGLYPQLVIQRDLGGKFMTPAQVKLVSNKAIASCDMAGGHHLGIILDNAACRYDPTKDRTVLCESSGGTNKTDACVSRAEALAMNKIWYGMTSDGSVPDPALDNGWGTPLGGVRRWYGVPRGTDILQSLAGPNGAILSKDLVAMVMQKPSLGSSAFVNAAGNGADGWKEMTYADLTAVFDRAVELQPTFAHLDADNADLSAFRAHGGKMIVFNANNDTIIHSQGALAYHDRLARKMGAANLKGFYRMFTAPGMGHIQFANGTTNSDALIPVAGRWQFRDLIVNWVEKGIAPDNVVFTSETGNPEKQSLPVCEYPKVPAYVRGDSRLASSYRCR